MDLPICNLCREKPANQLNSHLLPKFLKNNYLKYSKSAKFYLVNSRTKEAVIKQDLPKENNLFCSDCEKRLNTVETLSSHHLKNSYDFLKSRDYPEIRLFEYKYQMLKGFNSKVFCLFIYSLVWRMHISNLAIFKDYKIPNDCAEDLRKTLDITLAKNSTDLYRKIELMDYQRWDYIFIKPEKRQGIYHNINFNDGLEKKVSIVFAFEYIIFFFLDSLAIPKMFSCYVNQDFKEVKLLIFDIKTWNDFSLTTARSIIGK